VATDQTDHDQQSVKPSGDPEKMDRGKLVAELDRLQIPIDAGASEDALRAALRRAPETIAERETREEALRNEQGVSQA
jgi:hypothetical protein